MVNKYKMYKGASRGSGPGRLPEGAYGLPLWAMISRLEAAFDKSGGVV